VYPIEENIIQKSSFFLRINTSPNLYLNNRLNAKNSYDAQILNSNYELIKLARM